MQIKPIRTKADYRAALKEIENLMHAEAGTPDGERLDLLARLVEAYERKHQTGPSSKSGMRAR
jgi:HTH-type transcriptional regulator / antitoxin HigA